MHGQLLFCLCCPPPIRSNGAQSLGESEELLISEGEIIATKSGGAKPSFLKCEFLLTRTPPPSPSSENLDLQYLLKVYITSANSPFLIQSHGSLQDMTNSRTHGNNFSFSTTQSFSTA